MLQGEIGSSANLHNIFFRFRSDFLAFFARISYFLNFWSLRNLIKQLFHSRLLDMRLVIAHSALRASLAIYNLMRNLKERGRKRAFSRDVTSLTDT